MSLRSIVVALFVTMLAAGCRSAALAKRVPPEHIIMMNSQGKVVDPSGNTDCSRPYGEPCEGRHTIWRGYRELSNFETAEYAEHIINNLRGHPVGTDGKRHILIFIHGGLNSGVGAIRRATSLSNDISAAGYYPIFINWNSALISSYREHIFYIRQGEHWGSNPISLGLTPFYFIADLLRSLAKTPVAWFQMIRSDRESSPRSRKNRMAKEEAQRLASSQADERESLISVKLGRDLRTDAERSRSATGYFVTIPTKLATVPIIDGFGANAWETLIRRTRVLFHTDEELSVSRVRYRTLDPSSKGKLLPLGGLSIFLRHLSQFLDKEKEPEWEITIVAHSMGAIVANEIIRNYGDTSAEGVLPVRDVVYFAAAASLRDYEDTIFPFLAANRRHRMYHLTLHRVAEVRDTVSGLKLGGFDLAPRGSLLVWIDNYLSRPNIPLDRTAGRFVNLMTEVHDTPKSIENQISIREFDAGESVSRDQPQHHGDFGWIRFWDQDCWLPSTAYSKNACFERAPKLRRGDADPVRLHH